jgi:tetratricopeptide (TPR) repeat protein
VGSLVLDDDLGDLPQRLLTADPEDVDLRTALADRLGETGQKEAALAELDKVLELNPEHLRARYLRGGLLYELDRPEAKGDFSYLVDHPRFGELLRESARTVNAFTYSSWLHLRRGETDKAILVALRGLEYAQHAGKRNIQGELHYALACAYAAAARSNPERLRDVAAHLFLAIQFNNIHIMKKFESDPNFDNMRSEIALRLAQLDGDHD